jgi:hypothetical protein
MHGDDNKGVRGTGGVVPKGFRYVLNKECFFNGEPILTPLTNTVSISSTLPLLTDKTKQEISDIIRKVIGERHEGLR